MFGTNLYKTVYNSVELTLSPYGPVGINDDNDGWWYNSLRKNNITNMFDDNSQNIFEETFK
ncbi:MAG TPA: hypothetical protein PLV12_13565, partial [Saprospiraceae bacterium]|nr:hypothetical protein [Saprospiraceae bacterium]